MRTPDIVAKTSATMDGHEAVAPDLCPDVPPWNDEQILTSGDDEFPPVKSPILMRARRVSLDSEASTPRTPTCRAGSGSIGPAQVSSRSSQTPQETIGAEEPPWLKKRRAERLAAQRAEIMMKEISEHLHKGHHHYQVTRVEGEEPPPELFGAPPPELNVVFLQGLDPKLTSTEGLQQDLTQKAGMPSIKAIRLPLRFRHGPGPANDLEERVAVGNRGYAYLEFEDATRAAEAVTLLRTMKLNGVNLKADISNPTAPVYEERILFLPSLPVEVLGDDVETEQLLRQMVADEYVRFLADERSRRKRASEDAQLEHSDAKRRCRSEREAVSALTVSESSSEPSTTTPPPWEVKSVRLKSDGSWRYGFIEFHSRSTVIEVLRWQKLQGEEGNKEAFCIKGQQIPVAPSIPKKQRSVIVHPNRQNPRMGRTLFLSNLPVGMKEAKVRALCEEHGKVVNMAYPVDPSTNQTKGWALVEYATNVEAATASSHLQGRKCGPKTLNVKPSTSVITKPEGEEEGAVVEEEEKRASPELEPLRTRKRLNLEPVEKSGGEAASRETAQTNDDFRKLLGL